MVNPDDYEIVEWVDGETQQNPIGAFFDSLEEPKKAAVVGVLAHHLAREGPDVCNTEWGKNLGGGLYELRIRHELDEILARFRPDLVGKWTTESTTILVRVFFHPYGNKLLLLLGGYDKGASPKKKRQDMEIQRARDNLKKFRRQSQQPASFLERWRAWRKAGKVR